MKKGSGYLTSVTNPNFSGLAKVIFRNDMVPDDKTEYVTCHTEAGFGVRQIVDTLGRNGRLTNESAHILVDYTIDELGRLQSISVEEALA